MNTWPHGYLASNRPTSVAINVVTSPGPGYRGGYAPWLDAATCATAEAVTATTSSGSRDMAGAELVTGGRRG